MIQTIITYKSEETTKETHISLENKTDNATHEELARAYLVVSIVSELLRSLPGIIAEGEGNDLESAKSKMFVQRDIHKAGQRPRQQQGDNQ